MVYMTVVNVNVLSRQKECLFVDVAPTKRDCRTSKGLVADLQLHNDE